MLVEKYRHFGDVENPRVICKSSDNNSNLAFPASLFHVPGQARDGKRRPVDPRHEQTFQDDAVELSLGTASQETVQLMNVKQN